MLLKSLLLSSFYNSRIRQKCQLKNRGFLNFMKIKTRRIDYRNLPALFFNPVTYKNILYIAYHILMLSCDDIRIFFVFVIS